jgi:tRNA(fMet)-specific endonuclease VapC
VIFLDTTLLIDFLRGEPSAVGMMERKKNTLFFTSEINVFELIDGVYSSNRDVKEHIDKVYAMLTRLIVLPFDRKAAIKAGEISGELTEKGIKIGDTDCLIAGVVLSNGLTEIMTLNTKHFSRVPGLETITY